MEIIIQKKFKAEGSKKKLVLRIQGEFLFFW